MGLAKMLKIMNSMFTKGDKAGAEDEALFMTAAMVGALTLARAVDDEGLSDRILAVARARGIGRVYFFARDGWLPMEIARRRLAPQPRWQPT